MRLLSISAIKVIAAAADMVDSQNICLLEVLSEMSRISHVAAKNSSPERKRTNIRTFVAKLCTGELPWPILSNLGNRGLVGRSMAPAICGSLETKNPRIAFIALMYFRD